MTPHRHAGLLFIRFLACLLMLALSSCKGRKDAATPRLHHRVVEIVAVDATLKEAGLAGATDEALRQAAQTGLSRAGIEVALSAAPRPVGDFRLRIEVRLRHLKPDAGATGQSVLRAEARGRLSTPPSPSGMPVVEITQFDQDAVAERKLSAPPDPPVLVEHAVRTVQDTALALGSQLALLAVDRQMLIQTLQRKDLDSDLRGVAMRLAAARKEREAVPALIDLLKDPEMEIRDKAIGALIEIGDRRAVKPLCASAAFHDTFELGKILEAVAALGGEEARSYLEFVASGHQSEQIRAEAKVALGHLSQREAGDAGKPREVPLDAN